MASKVNQKIELEAQPRVITGRKVKDLRMDGLMPGILYGKGQESVTLQLPTKDFEKVFKTAGESSLVYLKLGGTVYPTIIHDVTRDPIKDAFLHADFYKVSLTEKIKTKVPVVFVGESAAVKSGIGILVRNVNELEVEALPQNLPSEISIDISKLANVADQVLVGDLSLGSDIEITASPEDIIALVQEPISQEELDAQLAEPTEVKEVEIVGEKEKAEKEAAEAALAEGESGKAEEKKEE